MCLGATSVSLEAWSRDFDTPFTWPREGTAVDIGSSRSAGEGLGRPGLEDLTDGSLLTEW